MWKGAIARNVGLLTAANLLMRGVGMLFQVYLTARVGAAGVGLLQLITAVQFFAMTLGTSGLRVAALTLTAEEYGYRRFGGVRQAMVWCLGAGLALSTLVGGLLLVLAEPVAVLWVRDVQAIKSLRLLGITLPVNCLSAVLAGCFTACGQVRKLVAVEIGDKIATVGITMLLLRRGVAGDLAHACASIVAGNALAAAGSVTVLLVLLYRWLRNLEGERASGMGGRLWRIAVPVALSDYLRSGLSTLEQFLIPWGFARNSGSSSQAMADYGTIHGMVFPILMFPSTVLGAVSDVLVPELARRRAQGNRERIESLIRRCLVLGLFYGAAVAGLLYVLASPLGEGIYHSADAGRYLKCFAPLAVMLYLDLIVDGMHKGLGQQVYCVRVNTITSVLDVALLFFLLPRFGVAGYYWSFVLSHGVNFYLSIGKLLSVSGARLPWGQVCRGMAAAGVAAAVVAKVVEIGEGLEQVLLVGGIYLALTALLLLLTAPVDTGGRGAYNGKKRKGENRAGDPSHSASL